MALTFLNKNKYDRDLQPALGKIRAKYRSHRVSEKENLENNLFKIDISRILNSLNLVESQVVDYITYFVGDVNDIDYSSGPNDGLSYELTDVDYYDEDESTLYQDVNIDSIPNIAATLSRIENKLSRLEKDYYG